MIERKIRGYSILAKGDTPEVIEDPNSDKSFLIPSQSTDQKYKVRCINNVWLCSCPDYIKRQSDCKHIYAVKLWLNLKERLKEETFDLEKEECNICAYCKSTNVVKNGFRKCKNRNKQRFVCKDCNRTFIFDQEFAKIKSDPRIITLSMDLYFKGLSLRKITDTIYQFHGIKIHHDTIRRWVVRFTKVMSEYVKQFKPEVSYKWHADEMMFKVKKDKKYLWLWNAMDNKTRFLLSQHISEGRTLPEATQFLQKAKDRSDYGPVVLVTDKMNAYHRAFGRVLWSIYGARKRHEQIKGLTKSDNLIIERLHSSIREREKVFRALNKPETATQIFDGWQVYYNFLRPHMGLNGETPSQEANIELFLDQNRWLSLLRRSLQTI